MIGGYGKDTSKTFDKGVSIIVFYYWGAPIGGDDADARCDAVYRELVSVSLIPHSAQLSLSSISIHS